MDLRAIFVTADCPRLRRNQSVRQLIRLFADNIEIVSEERNKLAPSKPAALNRGKQLSLHNTLHNHRNPAIQQMNEEAQP